MNSIFKKVASICLGYSIAHVLIFYMFLSLFLNSLIGERFSKIESGVNAGQVKNILVASLVLSYFSSKRDEEKVESTYFFIGVGVFLVAVGLRAIG